MFTLQSFIILFFFGFTGWLISWVIVKLLFWPVVPIQFGKIKFQGLVPAGKKQFAETCGNYLQQIFFDYKGLDDQLSDPRLIDKLKPLIEEHVDHFLKEKLKIVFPILAQFIGEKTIGQFKTAFLAEIDLLLPIMLKKYVQELKNELNLESIISQEINVIHGKRIQDLFYLYGSKKLFYFSLICTCIALFMGGITILILTVLHT